MSEEIMRYTDFLEQIGDGLLSTQELLENIEEATEDELKLLQGNGKLLFIGDGTQTSIEFFLDKLNDAITDLACMQEDIRDEVEDTPFGLRLP
jgi:hypothetical protein